MRRGRRRLLVSGLLVGTVLAVAWGAYGLWGGGKATSSVRTVAATRANVVDMITAVGVLQSRYSANVDFSTAGTVKDIDVKVGDAVSKGQRLATLEDALANKQVQAARANVDAARQQLSDAVTRGAPTAQPRAQVQQAELQLEQAQDALAATVLTAPGEGTVVSLSGSVGQRTGGGGQNSGTGPFLVITDMANLAARVRVAETDVSKLKSDQQASVTVNALPNQPIQAKVTEIDLAPTSSEGIARYGVSLALSNPPPTLRPGQSASAQVTVAEAENTLAVPAAALQTAAGQSTVTVLTKGQQVRRTVGTGVRGEALVQITTGLQDGEQVVLPSASGGHSGSDRGSGSGSRFGGG